MNRMLTMLAALCIAGSFPALAQNRITCTGILIAVDMVPRAMFPMAVIYDNTEEFNPHTCVLDVGPAGHWPLRGACSEGFKCRISGRYFKKIGHTYYMREWDKAESPDDDSRK
jgi:hypothetical protein